MNIYEILLIAFSVLSVMLCLFTSKKIKNIVFLFSSALLVYLFAVQDISVGADTIPYYNTFYYINSLSLVDLIKFGWEPGYLAINWLIGRFFVDGRALIVFLSLFILYPIARWIHKESFWPELSLVVFVASGMWLASMGIFRQWCAMAILTFSYQYIKKRDFYKFLGIVILAMCFHRTAVVFLLAYFLYKVPINSNTIVFSMPFSLLVGISGGYILQFLNKFARIAEEGNFNGGISMLIVLWSCVFIIFIIFRFKIPMNIELYYRLVFLAAFLQPIAFTFSNWARVVVYFSISLIILLPNVIVEMTRKMESYPYRIPMGICFCACMYVWLCLIPIRDYIFTK